MRRKERNRRDRRRKEWRRRATKQRLFAAAGAVVTATAALAFAGCSGSSAGDVETAAPTPTPMPTASVSESYVPPVRTEQEYVILPIELGMFPDEPRSIFDEMLESKYISDSIPLTYDLQVAVRNAAESFDVPFELVLAVIFQESRYEPSAVSSDGTCFGLMQINKVNFDWLQADLADYGVKDVRNDPEDNVWAGTYLLGYLIDKYGDEHKALMAYNCGEAGAKRLWAKGYYTTKYSRSVMQKAGEIFAAW